MTPSVACTALTFLLSIYGEPAPWALQKTTSCYTTLEDCLAVAKALTPLLNKEHEGTPYATGRLAVCSGPPHPSWIIYDTGAPL